MKKHINTAEIMGELEGSVFFPSKPQAPMQQVQPPVKEDVNSSTPVRDVPPVPPVLPVPVAPLERDVRPVPLKKRFMKPRHPFDIYHDQYDTLKQLAEDERRQGGVGSMSAMVREALDKFIATKKRQGK
jgi:hypothetical protein